MEKDKLTGKMAPHFEGVEVLCEHATLLQLHGSDAQSDEDLFYQRTRLKTLSIHPQHTVDSILGILLSYHMIQ